MLPHAPGMQMANIPEDAMSLKEDTDDANPDERNPIQDRDKHMEHDGEFLDTRTDTTSRTSRTGRKIEPW